MQFNFLHFVVFIALMVATLNKQIE